MAGNTMAWVACRGGDARCLVEVLDFDVREPGAVEERKEHGDAGSDGIGENGDIRCESQGSYGPLRKHWNARG